MAEYLPLCGMVDDPLTNAIAAAGGETLFCAAVRISPRTLYDWRRYGVPDTRAHGVAAASLGLVSAAQIAAQRIALLAPTGRAT